MNPQIDPSCAACRGSSTGPSNDSNKPPCEDGNRCRPKPPASAIASLQADVETLSTLSIRHLSEDTGNRLQCNQLSVNAYPTLGGGFVYVGTPRYDTPLESDLATLFDLAECAGVTWLKFDADAALIPGLPVYGALEVGT